VTYRNEVQKLDIMRMKTVDAEYLYNRRLQEFDENAIEKE